jgi:serine phosphatase RsbU (regulator of sigma subunit)
MYLKSFPAGGALVLYTDGVVEDQRDLPASDAASRSASRRRSDVRPAISARR